LPFDLSSAIQILILAGGIYVVMSFVRTARGSSLVRGLAFALLGCAILFMWLSRRLELEVLAHMIQGAGPVAVVVLAILFQPELRRGIVQFAENPLLGHLMQSRHDEVLSEISRSVIAMANKRQGALIAFERKIPLDGFIAKSVRVNADVNRFLIDSIFHHGSALHDGAVIIRGDRVEAASSLFPLTESEGVSKSTGTRHRAALGLTEETDAVTLAVSEETGQISICKHGKMERAIPPSLVEERLRHALAGSRRNEQLREEPGHAARIIKAMTRHAGQKAGALAIAAGLFWFIYQGLRREVTIPLTLVPTTTELARSTPGPGTLQVVLPDLSDEEAKYHLARPVDGENVKVIISGTLSELEPLRGSVGATLHIPSDIGPGIHQLALDHVRWHAGESFVDDVDASWASATGPAFEIELLKRVRFALEPQHVAVLDGLTSRYSARLDQMTIEPATVYIEGPVTEIDKLGELGPDGEPLIELRLEDMELVEKDTSNRSDALRLHPDLVAMGFSLSERETVQVKLPIEPAQVDLRTIEKEIALICLDSRRQSELARWTPPSQNAAFSIQATAILLETDPNDDAWIEQTTLIRRFVQDNLQVYIDISEIPEASDRGTVQVYWNWKKQWREVLPVSWGTTDSRAKLDVRLVSEGELLLIALP
jgi:diadenylate cyclase